MEKIDLVFVPQIDYHLYKRADLSYQRHWILLVTYTSTGKISGHTKHYIKILKQAGLAVALIVAMDNNPHHWPEAHRDSDILSHCDLLMSRYNHGYDFSAWAHLLCLYPNFWQQHSLIFANDSVFGPKDLRTFQNNLQKMMFAPYDVISLTESYEYTWHLQSYFILFQNQAMTCDVAKIFWKQVHSFREKDCVIMVYEMNLGKLLQASGLRCSSLYAKEIGRLPKNQNPMLFSWKKLIEVGLPFVKIQVLREVIPGTDVEDFYAFLEEQGYPVAVLPELLQHSDRSNGVSPHPQRFPYKTTPIHTSA